MLIRLVGLLGTAIVGMVVLYVVVLGEVYLGLRDDFLDCCDGVVIKERQLGAYHTSYVCTLSLLLLCMVVGGGRRRDGQERRFKY